MGRPLLVVCPLGPRCTGIGSRGNGVIPNAAVFATRSSPFIKFTVSFPRAGAGYTISCGMGVITRCTSVRSGFSGRGSGACNSWCAGADGVR